MNRRNFNKYFLHFLIVGTLSPLFLQIAKNNYERKNYAGENFSEIERQLNNLKKITIPAEIELLVPTFLGNDQRRFYGRGVPQGLNLLHQFKLGAGNTIVGSLKTWSGAGWTGQPTIVREYDKIYLIIGSYDHSLRKIDLTTNQLVWQYKFDDVIKGTSTVYIDENAREENKVVILQGSRLGVNKSLSSKIVPSFRAISFRSGKEIWRLNIKQTDSYSRDNDSSPLYLGNGVLFNAGENGIGYFINSSTTAAKIKDGILQPEILTEVKLYEQADISRHRRNLVVESSPARLGDRLFLAAGSGHIYGISIPERKIVWDFYTGSDLDGTVVISKDGKLFCTIEKQYIPGNGGVVKLDPNKKPSESVEWFLPTGNLRLSSWEGGVIGSVAINDEYRTEEIPPLFATCAIDGNLYIGSQIMRAKHKKVTGWLLDKEYNTPVIAFKQQIGSSISTPIFTDGNKLIVATYGGVYLFKLNFESTKAGEKKALMNEKGEYYRLVVEEEARFKPEVSFEATPVVWDGIVRICARDGWMYTLG
ncbi:MAG: PQQ-like beta-propeller repeat protein [Oscillatoriaceae bacterium SKW80]|nr:PQQ-like beta-propeller repeat protein [Oscillatoriaceae bacterium SKYG93]MCX8122351.1 PQQ-like beta-propeller repeat protein [Oscillatoriaceae bacterium SKW80]MDW8452459.1 PQQ-binding-like beta-propeller repeat protein [Oscillatoriaceae cyanobacterium SKYGB_i_bin93]HIK27738.1 hypothetical protein [Oscillatoriaceae cyanobacterium M7585_C2015_266]